VSAEPKRGAPTAPLAELARVERIADSGVLGGTVAVIDGRAALILSTILAGSLRDRLTLDLLLQRMQLDPASRAAALRGWRALEEAGETWRRLPRGRNVEARGSGSAVPSQSMASPSVLNSRGAAGLLSLSARRVRQLAARGDLAGERTSGGWLFEREEVVAFRERRPRAEG
jgi:hypothetical protein